jgi:RAB protein geranylgeranyltransferase component A
MPNTLHLPNSEYDTIVVGTGLVESILAGALARVGKTVLHLDVNDNYGGQYSTLNLDEFHRFLTNPPQQNLEATEDETDTTFAELKRVQVAYKNAYKNISINYLHAEPNSPEQSNRRDQLPADMNSDAASLYRKFVIDLNSNLIYAGGDLVQLLIDSGVGRYLEFKLVDAILVYVPNKEGQYSFQRVPLSKGDIFKNNFVSLVEKRYLSKFIATCADFENTQLFKEYENRPFVEFLKAQDLSPVLQTFVLYAIAMVDCEDAVTTREGMQRVRRFIGSVGRYGTTPFLYPMFGMSEINQAFCRVGAVYNATYVLRRGITSIYTSDENKVSGVKCTAFQPLKCSHLVTNRDYTTDQDEEKDEDRESVLRCVLLSGTPVFEPKTYKEASNRYMGAAIVAYIPPKTFGEEQTTVISITQVDFTSSCTPKEKYMITFQTRRLANDDDTIAEQMLNRCIESIYPRENRDQNSELYRAIYRQYIRHSGEPTQKLNAFDNVYLCQDADASLDMEKIIKQAKDLFYKITGDETLEFLPKLPNPEGEDERDDASKLLGIENETPVEQPAQAETTVTDVQATEPAPQE